MNMKTEEYYFCFIFCVLLIICFARAFSVFLLPCILTILQKDIGIKLKEIKICWYAGLIRGCIAFALCFEVTSAGKGII